MAALRLSAANAAQIIAVVFTSCFLVSGRACLRRHGEDRSGRRFIPPQPTLSVMKNFSADRE
jgi:hypothetical protein